MRTIVHNTGINNNNPEEQVMAMRKAPLTICILLMISALSGCFGSGDVETSEGDDVTLGESPDDWPTYYVLTSGDLPSCPDPANLGKLYYVEDVAEFQACMSAGWQAVQIGGTSANVMINQPPIMEANVWFADDDLQINDGDTTFSMLYGLHWNVSDPDGTIAQVGIDTNGDMVIDITLSSNTGAYSGVDHTLYNGEVISGLFAIPMEDGLTFHRGETATTCVWSLTRTFTFLAIDDDGAMSWDSITMNALDPRTGSMGILYYGAYDAMELRDSGSDLIPQDDYDWLIGLGGSTCAAPAVFSLTFDSLAATSGDTDTLGVLTLVSGFPTNFQGQDGCALSVGVTRNGENFGAGCSAWDIQFSGTDSTNPVAGDTWTISEITGFDHCNTGANTCDAIYVDLIHDDGSGDSVNRRICSSGCSNF
jgi:hypothetical protein